ncbi:hypothetical protein PO909_032339 [Leuciscus waleckii]
MDAPERQLLHPQSPGSHSVFPRTRAGYHQSHGVYVRCSVHPRARSGPLPYRSVVRESSFLPSLRLPRRFRSVIWILQCSSPTVWSNPAAGYVQSPGSVGTAGSVQLLGSAPAASSMCLVSSTSGFPAAPQAPRPMSPPRPVSLTAPSRLCAPLTPRWSLPPPSSRSAEPRVSASIPQASSSTLNFQAVDVTLVRRPLCSTG